MLLQICEPGKTPAPHEKDLGPVIGIDLGTTLSAVSIVHKNKPMVLNLADGRLVPSAIRLTDGGLTLVGKNAIDSHGGQLILSIKRLMGQPDLPESTIIAAGKQWTAVELSALILKHLKTQAESVLKKPISQAVITVPAYFDDAARNATKQAALLAGLTPLRLLNEPTAAALAYGLEANPTQIFAVYDLGGGTFDFTLLKPHQGVFQVLSTGGDTHLGGDDFDRRLYTLIAQKHPNFPPLDATLQLIIRRLKERFSQEERIDYTISYHSQFYSGTIYAEDFSKACQPEIERTLSVCRQALADAQLETHQVGQVILVGGSTRLKAISHAVESFFHQKPLTHLQPDETVALGAGLIAHALSQGSKTLLLDVTPLSLGIETMGGLVEKIIPRNTPIPAQVTQHFTTAVDGQTALKIHVLQGEREQVADCRSLAHLSLKGIPPLPAGSTRISVTFSVDVDGLLTVAAQEELTGTTQSVEVNPTYGLSQSALLALLKNDLAHAKEDYAKRILMETKLLAEQLIQATQKALTIDGCLLTTKATNLLLLDINNLERAALTDDVEAIQKHIQTLKLAAHNFAQLRLEHAVKSLTQ